MTRFTRFLLLFLMVTAAAACRKQEAPILFLNKKTSDYPGKLAHDWLALTTQIARQNALAAPYAARAHAYLGLTLWEAVRPGISGAKSLASQINDYSNAPEVDQTREYDWGIVLSSAMLTAFPKFIENITPAQQAAAMQLAIAQEDSLVAAGNLTETVRTDSRDLGVRIGLAIAERAQHDGRALIRDIVPVLPDRDDEHRWYWDPYTLGGQTPVEPLWSTVHTFAITNAQSCEVDAPLPYSEDPVSTFYQEGLAVKDLPRSDANRAIAYHWEDDPARAGSPATHWMLITKQLLESRNANLAECARAYCLAGLSLSDGCSVAWRHKYKYNLLRPVTYIREVLGQPNFKPLLYTPPYPEYVSAAATMGGAASTALISLFGDIAFTDESQLGSPLYTPDGGPFLLPKRSFSSVSNAGEEAAYSRLAGGVNFPRGANLGLEAGRCVGQSVVAKLNFGL